MRTRLSALEAALDHLDRAQRAAEHGDGVRVQPGGQHRGHHDRDPKRALAAADCCSRRRMAAIRAPKHRETGGRRRNPACTVGHADGQRGASTKRQMVSRSRSAQSQGVAVRHTLS